LSDTHAHYFPKTHACVAREDTCGRAGTAKESTRLQAHHSPEEKRQTTNYAAAAKAFTLGTLSTGSASGSTVHEPCFDQLVQTHRPLHRLCCKGHSGAKSRQKLFAGALCTNVRSPAAAMQRTGGE